MLMGKRGTNGQGAVRFAPNLVAYKTAANPMNKSEETSRITK